MDHQSKLSNFSLVENKGRYTLILNDRDVSPDSSMEEREQYEWGTITWRMPFVVSRYLQQLTPEQQRNLLMPHVMPLRQMQGLTIASIGTVRGGLGKLSLKIQSRLARLLNDFHDWAGRQEENELAGNGPADGKSRYTVRFAESDDAAEIYRFICELAAYERESQAVEVTPEQIATQLASIAPPFECLMVHHGNSAVGCALFFQNYSTWTGRPGLYLEDLYVEPSHRKSGAGSLLLQRLAVIAMERGYTRMDWSVLNWNESMHGFCRALGASPMEEWTTWRLDQTGIAALAKREI